MAQDDTSVARPVGTALVIRPGTTGPRPSLARSSANADFLSQMIAERQHLAVQRARRRAPLDRALDAYAEADRRDVPRLPAGFFRCLSV